MGILANIKLAHGRNLLRGAIRYISERQLPVQVELMQWTAEWSVEALEGFDGIIAGVDELDPRLVPTDIPAAWIGGREVGADGPVLEVAHEAIGKVAAEALLEFGVVSFGYYDGMHDGHEIREGRSKRRFQGFCDCIEAVQSPLIPTRIERHGQEGFESLVRWLDQLPKPAGVFAFNDMGAMIVADACQVAGIRVPDEISVVGVDNDRLMCMLSKPYLTSVDPKADAVAFEAMHRLLQEISGLRTDELSGQPAEPVIYRRESTGGSSYLRTSVSRSFDTIRRVALDELTPAAVAGSVDRSLRRLEDDFRETLGETLQQAIINERVRRAKRQLRDSNDSFEKIAELLGLEVRNFRKHFSKVAGLNPGEYRSLFRGESVDLVRSPVEAESPEIIRICCLNNLDSLAARDFIRGAEHFLNGRSNVQLSLHVDTTLVVGRDASLKSERPPYEVYDGFICIPDVELSPEVIGGKPVLALEHQRPLARSGSLVFDSYEAGVLAAEHFLAKGYQDFAFCAIQPDWVSLASDADDEREDQRYRGFVETLLESGVSEGRISRASYVDGATLIAWLTQLPKPCALMAYNDVLASILLTQCHRHGIRVPEDLAVLGVDNDNLLGQLQHPALSSVAVSFERMGYVALQDLTRVIEGEVEELDALKMVQPWGVVERASTAGLACNDATLHQAVGFIHRHFREPISAEQIAEACGVSRRALEYQFKRLLQTSPRAYLEVERLSAARALLCQTQWTVEEVADELGFKSGSYFTQVFKRKVGVTPLDFRSGRAPIVAN
ncbi:transcriptional regulator, AraC family [Coraliomargarita akajimensis DSM 45221]|uniref:Transcriptional regulator, AraC family n=1 Tax=Coraliomargarita akajimensis (strain DSM 45221 / IAM 15411 / JCM 23193 / KCTC 12865 / 04OKA010-24) TaxID=583355 RepID=D5EMI1_CORAD|nr:transcriptional regulator, AraC family [Coraliomargarita akajimensis DSM 45221]